MLPGQCQDHFCLSEKLSANMQQEYLDYTYLLISEVKVSIINIKREEFIAKPKRSHLYFFQLILRRYYVRRYGKVLLTSYKGFTAYSLSIRTYI